MWTKRQLACEYRGGYRGDSSKQSKGRPSPFMTRPKMVNPELVPAARKNSSPWGDEPEETAGPWASEYSEKYIGCVENVILGRAVECVASGGADGGARDAGGGGDAGGGHDTHEGGVAGQPLLSVWSLAEPGRPVSASFAPSAAPQGGRARGRAGIMSGARGGEVEVGGVNVSRLLLDSVAGRPGGGLGPTRSLDASGAAARKATVALAPEAYCPLRGRGVPRPNSVVAVRSGLSGNGRPASARPSTAASSRAPASNSSKQQPAYAEKWYARRDKAFRQEMQSFVAHQAGAQHRPNLPTTRYPSRVAIPLEAAPGAPPAPARWPRERPLSAPPPPSPPASPPLAPSAPPPAARAAKSLTRHASPGRPGKGASPRPVGVGGGVGGG
ncbi:hypothetical protein T484DRAFT_1900347, partial [Baffinella frigidus]